MNERQQDQGNVVTMPKEWWYRLQDEYNSLLKGNPKMSMAAFRRHVLKSMEATNDAKKCPSIRSFQRHLCCEDKEGGIKPLSPKKTNIMPSKENKIKMEITRHVASCGHYTHPKLKAFLDKHYPTEYKNNVCHSCMTHEETIDIQRNRDEEVLRVMNSNHCTRDLEWPDAGYDVTLGNGCKTTSAVEIVGGNVRTFIQTTQALKRCTRFVHFMEKQ